MSGVKSGGACSRIQAGALGAVGVGRPVVVNDPGVSASSTGSACGLVTVKVGILAITAALDQGIQTRQLE